MKLKKTQTGQVVFEQDLSDLDISKIILKPSSANSSDLIERFHGYVPTTQYVGRQCNYSIWCQGHEIGFTGIGSAIMAMKGRDTFIGWTKQQRMHNLTKIANNWRYTLIDNLPKNTGSKVISMVINQARIDWKKKYGDELVLLETLVEAPRTGIVYRASGWIEVGETLGTQYAWRLRDEVKPNEQIVRQGFKLGDNFDENRVKVISGGTTKKVILIKPINRRWKKILRENPKCEECISFNKIDECKTCTDRIVRLRIAHHDKWPRVLTDEDSVSYEEGDGRPFRL